MKIFIVGSLNMDLVIKALKMPRDGETIAGSDFMTNVGGKGGNQAVAVSLLGGDSYMVGCVGDSFDDEILFSLTKCGVHTDYVRKLDSVSSGIAVIVVVNGENRIILDCGANGELDIDLVDEAFAAAEAGDYVLLQLEIDVSVVEYTLKKAKEYGMITVLNPAPAKEISVEALQSCDFFTPNQSEAEFYTGIYPKDKEGALRCAKKMKEFGAKNVVITMGTAGSVAHCGKKTYSVSAFCAGEAVDTTAAGDTYIGALVTRLSEGADMQEAMLFASKASAVTVTRRGAQCAIPFRREIDAL